MRFSAAGRNRDHDAVGILPSGTTIGQITKKRKALASAFEGREKIQGEFQAEQKRPQ